MHSKSFLVLEISLFLTLVAVHRAHPMQRRPPSSLIQQEERHFIINQFHERELARIFLTNTGNIPRDLRSDLNETGVLHFLAISAGQLLPVIKGMEYIASSASLLGRTTLFARLMRHRAALALGIGAYLSLIYGLTGSLMRLLFIDFLHRYACELLMRICSRRLPYIQQSNPIAKTLVPLAIAAKEPVLFVLICLCITALLGRNLLEDWSFLFASMGALACVIGLKTARMIHPMLGTHHTAVKWLFTTVAIQLCATLLMSPLTAVSMGPALLTNLIIAPVVGLLVVPSTVLLSLILQVGVAKTSAFGPLVGALVQSADIGLILFRKAAQFFAALDDQNRVPLFKPFSEDAYLYTVSVIGLCWFGPRLWNILRARLRGTARDQTSPSKERSSFSVMMGTPNS